MKKILYLLFFVCAFTQAQNVNIPDANFKSRLLQANTGNNIAKNINGNYMKIDANGDNQIQVSEAMAVYELNVSGSSSSPDIMDLTGVGSFANLTNLLCYSNSLTSLDVSMLSNLTFINCSHNNLVSLNVAGLTNLTSLHCNANNFTNLDITGLTNLMWLHYDNNNIPNLDVTGLVNLTSLSCKGNNITDLDVTGLANLTMLDCSDNNLSEIDVTGLTNLIVLDCADNNLTEVDLSNNPDALLFDVSGNPITYLNIKNGNDFGGGDMQFDFISSLSNNLFICANNFDIPVIQPYLNQNGNTDQVLTSYCSFVPAGNFNTITGTISFDVDNNGNCGNDNYPLPLFKVILDDGTDTGVTYTNISGDYPFYTLDGTYTITPEFENPAYFDSTPALATVNLPLVNNSIETEDFCVNANGVHPDLEITIAPVTPARPGFDADYLIVYKNIGNQTMSQSNAITFLFDNGFMDFVSSSETPSTQAGGSLTWDYANLKPFESRSIEVTFEINPPTDPFFPVNIDDIFTFTTQIEPIAGDENPTDNLFELKQTVVGAFDPNDITCLQGDALDPMLIGEELHYLVRFENEGNFAADNVFVEMDINPNQYQVHSMRILRSSHSIQAKITGNSAEYLFEGIQLPPAGQGYILIAIKPNNNLQNGDSVVLNADIFFDFNYPITTNDAVTVFGALGVHDSDKALVALYPNPTTDFISITSEALIESIAFYDLRGRLVASETIHTYKTQYDLSLQPAGLYMVKIQTTAGVTVQKIVKR
ncbi:MAG: T9SS type A sorting domain-containing protein [Salibacteraceae bacterium]